MKFKKLPKIRFEILKKLNGKVVFKDNLSEFEFRKVTEALQLRKNINIKGKVGKK